MKIGVEYHTDFETCSRKPALSDDSIYACPEGEADPTAFCALPFFGGANDLPSSFGTLVVFYSREAHHNLVTSPAFWFFPSVFVGSDTQRGCKTSIALRMPQCSGLAISSTYDRRLVLSAPFTYPQSCYDRGYKPGIGRGAQLLHQGSFNTTRLWQKLDTDVPIGPF